MSTVGQGKKRKDFCYFFVLKYRTLREFNFGPFLQIKLDKFNPLRDVVRATWLKSTRAIPSTKDPLGALTSNDSGRAFFWDDAKDITDSTSAIESIKGVGGYVTGVDSSYMDGAADVIELSRVCRSWVYMLVSSASELRSVSRVLGCDARFESRGDEGVTWRGGDVELDCDNGIAENFCELFDAEEKGTDCLTALSLLCEGVVAKFLSREESGSAWNAWDWRGEWAGDDNDIERCEALSSSSSSLSSSWWPEAIEFARKLRPKECGESGGDDSEIERWDEVSASSSRSTLKAESLWEFSVEMECARASRADMDGGVALAVDETDE
jgi:hypothetical protein